MTLLVKHIDPRPHELDMRVHRTLAVRDRRRLNLKHVRLIALAVLDPAAAAVEHFVHLCRLGLQALLVMLVGRSLHVLVLLKSGNELSVDFVKVVNARISEES